MMKIVSKYFIVIIFLLSAFLKMLDYRATVELFVNLLGISYTFTKIFLAVLILLELTIAYLIIADYLKIKTIYILILGVITLFLLANIYFELKGFGNCGCFGAAIGSTPALSILKNILLISAVIYLKHSFATLRLREGKRVR